MDLNMFDVEAQTARTHNRGSRGASKSPGLLQRARAAIGRGVAAVRNRFRR